MKTLLRSQSFDRENASSKKHALFLAKSVFLALGMFFLQQRMSILLGFAVSKIIL